jgi:hypothetical protein
VERSSDQRLDLDEAWAPLHFTLTGEYPIPREKAEEMGIGWDERSLENVIMGGDATPLAAGYGPARYLSPESVRALAGRLSTIDPEGFRSRIDPQSMVEEGTLPDSWDSDSASGLLQEHFARLKRFYGEAAASDDGILIVIT